MLFKSISLKSKRIFGLSKYSPASDLQFCIFKRVPYSRFSFGIVATKKLGCAVVRNKIKRRIKNALQLAMKQVDPPKDVAIIAIARKECMNANFAGMVNAIRDNIRK